MRPNWNGNVCNFDEVFVTGCTENSHFDNFQCSQWWKISSKWRHFCVNKPYQPGRKAVLSVTWNSAFSPPPAIQKTPWQRRRTWYSIHRRRKWKLRSTEPASARRRTQTKCRHWKPRRPWMKWWWWIGRRPEKQGQENIIKTSKHTLLIFCGESAGHRWITLTKGK